jgi:Ca2+-binding EF-hand superfamily protein
LKRVATFIYGDESLQKKTEVLLTFNDLQKLKSSSGFSEIQIQALFRMFQALNPRNGVIPLSSLSRIPQLSFPLSSRLPKALGVKKRDISFPDFANAISVFSIHAPIEDKISFLFKLYDQDDDGKISRSDLKKTLTLLANDEDLGLIDYAVTKTFEELGDNEFIDRSEFGKVVGSLDVKSFVSFEI